MNLILDAMNIRIIDDQDADGRKTKRISGHPATSGIDISPGFLTPAALNSPLAGVMLAHVDPACPIASEYSYSDLDEGQIRVVEFLPPDSHLQIRCRIVTQSLQNGPAFEALSYTWGDHEKSEIIDVEGHTLPITWSLYCALYHLQSKYPRLWVDAICINQKNLIERADQVKKMPLVYSGAKHVAIWLGSATRETDAYMGSLEALESEGRSSDASANTSHCEKLGISCNLHGNSNNAVMEASWKKLWIPLQKKACNEDATFAFRQMFGLKDLMARSWFSRSWILQEVARAESASICCGTKVVSSFIFSFGHRLLGKTIGEHRQAILDIMPGRSKSDSWWSDGRDLLAIMRKFRFSQASESRDRIYALLGLCDDENIFENIPPDYQIADSEVVRKVLFHLFGTLAEPAEFHNGYTTISSLFQGVDEMESNLLAQPYIKHDDYRLEYLVRASAYKGDIGVFKAINFLLRKIESHDGRISPELILACASNTVKGSRILELIFHYCPLELWNGLITTEVIRACIDNQSEGRKLLSFLLQKHRNGVKVVIDMLQLAAQNDFWCVRVIELLVLNNGESVSTGAEDERRLAAKDSGHWVVEILLETYLDDNDLRQDRQALGLCENIMTDFVMISASRDDKQGEAIIEWLLTYCNGPINLTDTTVVEIMSCSQNGIILLLLSWNPRIVSLTRAAIEEIVGLCDVNVVQILLTNFGHLILDVQALLRTAWRSSQPGILNLILQAYGDKIEIDESVLRSVPGHSSNQIVLLKYGGRDLNLTQDTIQHLVEHGTVGAANTVLMEYKHRLKNIQPLFEIAVWKRRDSDVARAFVELYRSEIEFSPEMSERGALVSYFKEVRETRRKVLEIKERMLRNRQNFELQ